MEGRIWMNAAMAWGARLCPKMHLGGVYLYELYTTTFVHFACKAAAEAFVEWAKDNIDHWGYDPVALIDTNDPEERERWADHIEGPKTYQESILHGMVQGFETGCVFLPSSHELKNAGGSAEWWARSPGLPPEQCEVVITVEDGRVSGAYASNKDAVSVEIIDADTDDTDREAEIRDEMQELEKRVSAGELHQIW